MVALRNRNRRLALRLGGVAVAMVGAAYLLVPLYQGYCRMTGLNGATSRLDYGVALRRQADVDRWINVEFVTTTVASMPWEFRPDVPSIKVHPGQIVTTWFRAHNRGTRSLTGQAVATVTPGQAAPHFYYLDGGLCTSGQQLAAGESRNLPLQFLVADDLPPNIGTLTLSIAVFDATQSAAGSVGSPSADRRLRI
jgi:cytochrome c oxidase assembly protein subunit 11